MKESAAKALGQLVGTSAKLLTLLFLALRACDVIDWPWYWVLSPTLAGFLVSGVFSLFLLFVVAND